MKTILIVLCAMMLSACAGLNVSWNASYNMPQIAGMINPALDLTPPAVTVPTIVIPVEPAPKTTTL